MRHPILERLLEERGVADVEAFLNPGYEKRPDPFLMKDMEVAVSRILRAIEHGEKIAAWTDYDCDGIPAAALLADFFRMIGYPLRSYIPERSEGYGLNESGIALLKEEGVSLIITADVGITNISEVAFAENLGIDVIVSDHHLPLRAEAVGEGGLGEVLPPAVAVLNPHRADCEYPFKELCGTGVAFKLVEGIIRRSKNVAVRQLHFLRLPVGFEKWLLDLVALATVADMVELTGENRTLVRFGLVVLQKGRRKGLRALLDTMRVPLQSVTEDDIAFSIAPKINAASRMASPKLALELLTIEDDARAKVIAGELVKLNDARKLEGARVAKEVKQRLEGRALDPVIVLGNSAWKPALLGIAATNVVETYRRTVCLWGKEGDVIKGSCRSDGSVNIVSLMSATEGVFEDYGGHERSGGFSLKASAVHLLPEKLASAYARTKTAHEQPAPSGTAGDSRLALFEASDETYRALRLLAPFGIGNPKPIFVFENVRVEKMLWFGKHKEHARLTVSDGEKTTRDAVAFFAIRASYRAELELLSSGDTVTLQGAIEQSFFAGRKELRLRLENITLFRT